MWTHSQPITTSRWISSSSFWHCPGSGKTYRAMCTSTRLQLAAWRVSGIRLKPFGRHFHLCLTARKIIILSLVEMDMLVPNKEYVSLSNTITPDYTGNPYLSFQRRKPPLHTNILQVCPLMQLLCSVEKFPVGQHPLIIQMLPMTNITKQSGVLI